ncbi:MAG: 30S ribosomal protein S12 methylthiotransferase RimO [Coriobacteriia bacterium]|nr:30S ribosomal protein S12 methylthiotransferase RimO [Coriobacteriia bacterium]
MSESPAIAFITLGCPKNEVDSDRMAAAVQASAFRLVTDPDEADVVVLNTCSFIQPATEESIAGAFALAGEWRPARPGRKLVIAGCMVSRYGSDLTEALPEADAFLAVADEPSLTSLLESLTGVSAESHTPALRTSPGPTTYLKVSEGCDRRCSYCTIPSIRGPFVSTPPDELFAEALFLVEAGAREIVLVGQDVASYGQDLADDIDLSGLVARLDTIEGDFRIRLMYLQPDGVNDRLLETISRSAHVCHYLDIPLQHTSAPVLQAMGRTGDADRHMAMLDRIRLDLPDVVLRTTVIAGFPGETDDQAAELEAFLAEAAFDYVGVFVYSPEEGTPAASMPDQLPDDTRLERAQRLRDTADAVGFARAAALVGTMQRVLVEGLEDGESVGRTCGQAPDVDGLTVLGPDAPVGEFIDVRISEAVGYDLVGVTQ